MNEWLEQRDIIAWFKAQYPQHHQALRCSMNGLNLGSGRRAAIMMSQMQAQGAIKGESDLLFAIPRGDFGALVLEHKAAGSRHKLTPKQSDYLKYHESIGNCAVSTRGIGAAKAAIKCYMAREGKVIAPSAHRREGGPERASEPYP